MPGGKQNLGEIPGQSAIRECKEETRVVAEIIGLLGLYSDPAYLVEYTSDGEVRQEYEVTLIGRPIDGTPSATVNASASRWVNAADLDSLDIHPTMRRQIGDYLSGDYPVVD